MPRLSTLTRRVALLVIAGVYAVALAAAALAVAALPAASLEWQLGAASLAGTVAVFACSVLLDNSSAFDPYWSVAPMATVPWLLARAPGVGARALLATAIVMLWGARLTWNWARQWRGMAHEDFRYVDLRAQTGRAYWVVSFLGIHFFPALLVWFGSLSLIPAITLRAPLGWLDAVGAALALGATWLEALADSQLRAFRTSPHEPDAICDRGLWAWSRHPNYLGELLFWWGLWLLAFSADRGALWRVGGAVAITLLFNVVSIPLMEKRMEARRPAFAAHRRRVSRLLPWPPGDRT